MSETSIPVVTIDGPAGSGKGTVAQQLAKNLQFHYLDSGAMYRILALLSQKQNMAVDDTQGLIGLCKNMQVAFGGCDEESNATTTENVPVLLNGQEVSSELRTEECAGRASQVAAQPELREALLDKQRCFRKSPGLVAEGRDMGTVVFPDARHKFFLTASASERALRRQKQLMKQGISASLGSLLKDIETRDSRDQDRKVSPLRPATDAQIVDSTELSIEQVVSQITQQVRGRQ